MLVPALRPDDIIVDILKKAEIARSISSASLTTIGCIESRQTYKLV